MRPSRAKSASQISPSKRGSKLHPHVFCILPLWHFPHPASQAGAASLGWASRFHRLGQPERSVSWGAEHMPFPLAKTKSTWFDKGRWQKLRGWADLLLLRILVLVLLGVCTADWSVVGWALHYCFAGWIKRNLLRIEYITREKTEHSATKCLWHRWPWLFSQIWSPLSFWHCPLLPPSFLIINATSPVQDSFYPWGSPQGSVVYFIPASTFSPWLILFVRTIWAVPAPSMHHSSLSSRLLSRYPYYSPKLFTIS